MSAEDDDDRLRSTSLQVGIWPGRTSSLAGMFARGTVHPSGATAAATPSAPDAPARPHTPDEDLTRGTRDHRAADGVRVNGLLDIAATSLCAARFSPSATRVFSVGVHREPPRTIRRVRPTAQTPGCQLGSRPPSARRSSRLTSPTNQVVWPAQDGPMPNGDWSVQPGRKSSSTGDRCDSCDHFVANRTRPAP